ncbi:MAG TPA: ATP-binding protein [bacterium]|nr:ATP-binding protein [bacterium]
MPSMKRNDATKRRDHSETRPQPGLSAERHQDIENKSYRLFASHPEKANFEIAQTLAALANRNGGTLTIGAGNDAKMDTIPGNNLDPLQQRLANLAQNRCVPPVNISTAAHRVGKDRFHLEIRISRGTDLVTVDGRYFTRSGTTTREMSPSQVTAIILERFCPKSRRRSPDEFQNLSLAERKEAVLSQAESILKGDKFSILRSHADARYVSTVIAYGHNPPLPVVVTSHPTAFHMADWINVIWNAFSEASLPRDDEKSDASQFPDPWVAIVFVAGPVSSVVTDPARNRHFETRQNLGSVVYLGPDVVDVSMTRLHSDNTSIFRSEVIFLVAHATTRDRIRTGLTESLEFCRTHLSGWLRFRLQREKRRHQEGKVGRTYRASW